MKRWWSIRGGGVLMLLGVLACGATVSAEPSWLEVAEPVVADAAEEPGVPTGIVVPTPDGALAGLAMLGALGIGYWVRHHRARRSGHMV